MIAKRQFQLLLIKPSHYDDDGYVIRWWRTMIPSNSLAAIYGIAADCAERQVLGPDVAIDITVIDETNTRVDAPALLARLRSHGNFGLVGLIGVQSNQYPRALDIARPFRHAGIAVAMGGFHVSGCLSMLDGHAVDLDACREMGIAMFAGEAEGRLDGCCRTPPRARLRRVYNFMKDLPGMEGTPVPFLPKRYVARTLGLSTSFDAGRGCPYQCSFCTIINVQGRKSRYRSADDVEHLVRLNWAQGIHKFFITDDNFARNKEWEAIFDRLIELRERDGIPLGLMIQVDTLCHKIPNFIEKAKRAGVTRVFIGLENINPDNLAAAKKRQNKITEYRKMLLAWKAQGIITLAGYILGFPADTPETIRRDIAIMQKELPLDVIEFFCLTPLPGSEDHQILWKNGVAMDPDLNKYDVEHVCTAHPRMSKERVGCDLPRSLVALLHPGTHGDTAASRGGDRRADGQPFEGAGHVRVLGSPRKRTPAAMRHLPPQTPFGAAARPAARKFLDLLAALCLGKPPQALHCDRHDRAAPAVEDGDNTRSQRNELYGSGAHAGPRRRRRDVRSSHQDGRRAGCYCAHQEGRRADRRALGRLTRPVPLADGSTAALKC